MNNITASELVLGYLDNAEIVPKLDRIYQVLPSRTPGIHAVGNGLFGVTGIAFGVLQNTFAFHERKFSWGAGTLLLGARSLYACRHCQDGRDEILCHPMADLGSVVALAGTTGIASWLPRAALVKAPSFLAEVAEGYATVGMVDDPLKKRVALAWKVGTGALLFAEATQNGVEGALRALDSSFFLAVRIGLAHLCLKRARNDEAISYGVLGTVILAAAANRVRLMAKGWWRNGGWDYLVPTTAVAIAHVALRYLG